MRLGFRRLLVATHLGLMAAVVLVTMAALDRSLGADLRRQARARLDAQAKAAASWVTRSRRHPESLAQRLSRIVDAHVTLLEPDGRVIGISGPSLTEELIAAEARSEDDLVVRLALPASHMAEPRAALRRQLLLYGVLGFALALALALAAARYVERRVSVLTAERDRLQAILTGMVEGVLVVDGEGRVLAQNPSFRQLAGAAAPGDLPPAVRELVGRAVADGAPSEGEMLLGGAQLAVNVRPLALAGGRGAVCVLHDLTRLRRLETMRRDFVANVSHELRTPVTAIQGYAETLLDDAVPAERRREFLEIVHRHARRIGRLVEDLLRLAALEARPAPARARVDLGAAIQGALQVVREGTPGAADVTFEVAGEPGLGALGDAEGIEQVLENLLANAVRYGRPAGRITVAAERDGARVRLSVCDDGPGIATEHLPRLFERFYRVDAGRARADGGTGLGLAIVKHLAEAMGGRVAVASEPGRGSRFTVELPAA